MVEIETLEGFYLAFCPGEESSSDEDQAPDNKEPVAADLLEQWESKEFVKKGKRWHCKFCPPGNGYTEVEAYRHQLTQGHRTNREAHDEVQDP